MSVIDFSSVLKDLSQYSSQKTSVPVASSTTSTPAQKAGLSSGVVSSSGSQVSGVTSFLSGISSEVTSAENYVTSGVSSLLSGGVNGLSSTFSSALGSLFGDSSSSNTTAGNVKTAIPDPLKSSFSSGTPQSTRFKTTSATTGLTPQTIMGQKTTTTDKNLLGATNITQYRYGTDLIGNTVGSIKSGLNKITQSSVVSGLYSGLSTVVGTVSSVKTTAEGVISSVGGTLSGIYQSGLSEYRSIVGDLAQTLSGNSLGMDGLLNTDLPSVTDLNGNAISGIPTGTSAEGLTSLFTTAKSLGCDLSNINFTSYGAQQSAYGAMLGVSAQTNLTSVLSNLMNCNRFDSYGIDIAKQLFYQNYNTSVGTTDVIASKLGASQLTASSSVLKGIVTNPNLTASDSGTVSNIMSSLGVANNTAYTTGDTIGDDPIWDLSTLSNSQRDVASSLLGSDSSLMSIVNAQALTA